MNKNGYKCIKQTAYNIYHKAPEHAKKIRFLHT